jgi:SAM-dependent methyltransferase
MNKIIRQFYEEHLQKFGKDDIRSMGWHNEEEYAIRFELAVNGLDLDNSSILDVGCGFGGLYNYLKISGVKNFTYLGVDILPKMIEIAREKNPTGRFEEIDIIKTQLHEFDYVFCIGALNVETEKHEQYFREIATRMITLARKSVIINYLIPHKNTLKDPYHVEDPKELQDYFENKFQVFVETIIDERLRGEAYLIIKKK